MPTPCAPRSPGPGGPRRMVGREEPAPGWRVGFRGSAPASLGREKSPPRRPPRSAPAAAAVPGSAGDPGAQGIREREDEDLRLGSQRPSAAWPPPGGDGGPEREPGAGWRLAACGPGVRATREPGTPVSGLTAGPLEWTRKERVTSTAPDLGTPKTQRLSGSLAAQLGPSSESGRSCVRSRAGPVGPAGKPHERAGGAGRAARARTS